MPIRSGRIVPGMMSMEAPRRIAALDGLRAVSIALVLAGHVAGTRFAYSTATYARFGDLANLGVRVFFVLSGYVITMALLAEYRGSRAISLRQFYVRRTLRIFPAFGAFLLAVVCLHAGGLVDLQSGDLLHAATFTMNFHYVRAWSVGHLWSLSVEEQFYLLWPATLSAFGIRRALIGAALVVVGAPFVRLAIVMWWPSQVAGIGESFPTIADSIAVGCLAAGLRESLLGTPRLKECLTSRAASVAIPVALFLINLKAGGRLRIAVVETSLNVLIALFVLHLTLVAGGPVARMLNARTVVFVGTLSYSIYLWQQVFLNRDSDALVSTFPLNIACAGVIALISYLAVERPFLRRSSRGNRGRHVDAVLTDDRIPSSLGGR